jgi:very-short-patch-repair endonuclease
MPDGPVTVAQAREHGLSKEVLRGTRFWSPLRGVHVPDAIQDGLEARCHALAQLVPAATFSHLTAARLCDLPVPGKCTALGLPADERLEVTCPRTPPRLRGVWGHESDVGPDVWTAANGLSITTGARTWADLAPRLGLTELIVLGDAVLHRGWADLVALTAQASRPHRRGALRMRQAIPLLEPRSDSPMETRLRLLLVLGGLPCPESNRDVVVDGEWLARPDLSYPALRIAIEYDGDHHRTDRRQWQRDIGRRRLLEDAGWLLIVVTAADVLRHPEAIVERVRRAIAARAGVSALPEARR